jgi:hypothetical protein
MAVPQEFPEHKKDLSYERPAKRVLESKVEGFAFF